MLLALIKCLQQSLRGEITTKNSIRKCWRSCPGEPVTEEGSICCPAQNAQKPEEKEEEFVVILLIQKVIRVVLLEPVCLISQLRKVSFGSDRTSCRSWSTRTCGCVGSHLLQRW